MDKASHSPFHSPYVHTHTLLFDCYNISTRCMHSLSIILYSACSITALVFYIKKAICEWKVYELQQLNTRCQMIATAIFVVFWPSIVNVNLSLNAKKKFCLCDALCHFVQLVFIHRLHADKNTFLWFFTPHSCMWI